MPHGNFYEQLNSYKIIGLAGHTLTLAHETTKLSSQPHKPICELNHIVRGWVVSEPDLFEGLVPRLGGGVGGGGYPWCHKLQARLLTIMITQGLV